MSIRWMEEEVESLKDVYPKLGSNPEILKYFPGRTMTAITVKAAKLKLKVIHNIRKGRTNEEYLELVKDSNFIPLEEYRGSTTAILHRCKLCGHEWNTRPQHAIKEGSNCPNCVKSQLNTEEYVSNILSKADMVQLSPYLGSLKPIKLRHKCGHEWETKFSYIQQGSGCPMCNYSFGHRIPNGTMETILYVLELVTFNGDRFVKVGITSRKSIEPRLREIASDIGGELVLIKVHKKVLGTAPIIVSLENKLLTDESILRFHSGLNFSGKTELKCIDSLNKILEVIKGDKNVQEIL